MKAAATLLALVLGLAACDGSGTAKAPAPMEPEPDATAFYCGMGLNEHAGPKGQAFLPGVDKPLWFASVQETLTYMLEAGQDLPAVYVNDMGRASWDHPEPGTWVEARKAVYVLGSRRAAAMGGAEPVPFADRAAAERFAAAEGGRVVPFAKITAKLLASSPLTDHGGSRVP